MDAITSGHPLHSLSNNNLQLLFENTTSRVIPYESEANMWDRISLMRAVLGPAYEPPARRSDARETFPEAPHVAQGQPVAGLCERPAPSGNAWFGFKQEEPFTGPFFFPR